MRSRMLLWFMSLMVVTASGLAATPAFERALRDAKAGDTRSQYVVGMMYLFADGTTRNPEEGARWIERSANAGMPQGLVALAAITDIGYGVKLDEARATQLREQAAKAGNSTARSQLDLDRKLPGTRDFRRADALWDFRRYNEALPYAKKSADAGNPDGQELLGRSYLLGRGTAKNYDAAMALFRKADAAGTAQGARSLAYMYEFGLGVAVNRKEALKYYDRAAARGSSIARQAAANLRSPDYDQPPPPSGGGSGTVFCSSSYVYDFGMGYCRAPSESDPPNMQNNSGPH